jgi:hypothetical protein
VHPADGSGGVARPDGTVERFAVVAGRLRYPTGPRPTELRCTAGALRAALATLGPVELIPFVPAGAGAAPDHVGVVAVPVTDAVKRVVDGRVLATVDRTALRFLVGPACVPRRALEALLAALPDDAAVHPLIVGVAARS